MLEITSLPALKDNYIYVVTEANGHAAVIDPGAAQPVRDWLKTSGRRLSHILCTHHHLDHIGGVAELGAEHPEAKIYCSAYDRSRIPAANLSVHDGDILDFHGNKVEVLAMPGHTLGQVIYHFVAQKFIFSGDTLFSAGCGRLFEGNAEQMFNSLKKLKALAQETQVYFGHEYTRRNLEFVLSRENNAAARAYLDHLPLDARTTPTTLIREQQINPFYRASSVDEFSIWREARNHW